MELLHGIALIIFYLYYKYSHKITNHITGFIVLILISFLVLQNEQIKQLTNNMEKTDSELKLIKNSMIQQEAYIEKLNTNIVVMTSKQEKADSVLKLYKKTTESLQYNTQSQLVKQQKINNRFQNKILEMESNQDTADNNIKTLTKEMNHTEKTFGEIEKVYKLINKMDQKAEVVTDHLNKNLENLAENEKELRKQISSYESKIESLQRQINNYEEEESERHRTESSHQDYRSYQPVERYIPDIQNMAIEGIKRVVSIGATVVYHAAKQVFNLIYSIGSWFGGLLW